MFQMCKFKLKRYNFIKTIFVFRKPCSNQCNYFLRAIRTGKINVHRKLYIFFVISRKITKKYKNIVFFLLIVKSYLPS